MARQALIRYRHSYEFSSTPQELWGAIQEVDQFERWWPWLEEFRVEGVLLAPGSVLHGVVAPPVPYKMRIRVELTRFEAPTAIDAVIHGDLEGKAQLEIHPTDNGCAVEVAWTVEMMQRSMRMASRVALPLLQWGHDRVVEITVAGFRRRIDSADSD